MKLIKFGVLVLSMFALASCSNDVDDVDNSISEIDLDNLDFSETSNPGIAYFKAATAPELWIKHKSHVEKLAALNLPEKILSQLTLEQLTECCVCYPLGFEFFAHNDQVFGTRGLIDRFNGYSALIEMPGYGKALLDTYEGVCEEIASNNSSSGNFFYCENNSNIKKRYIERLIWTERFPDALTGENGQRLDALLTKYADLFSGDYCTVNGSALDGLRNLVEKYSK